MDILYVEGKSSLLMSNIQVNFGDILPETSTSIVFWDMGVDSHLKWLFSPNVNWDGTSLGVGWGLDSWCGRGILTHPYEVATQSYATIFIL